jgi:predicted dehydrogenase
MGAGALLGARPFWGRTVFAAPPNDKLRIAVIGCGGQGRGAHVPQAVGQHLVALVDADSKGIDLAFKRAEEAAKKNNDAFDPSKVRTFDDYRQLFDKARNDIDAVIVATPNHHHALPAMLAMKAGKGVYVEKPLCYNIDEARTLSRMSEELKAATQMGNQGHSAEGYRRLVEYIQAGAIGKVTEVHCWSDRKNGGEGPRPPTIPVPAGMNWDHWIGPAPYRDYHKDLHPHEWHGWHDFGDGSLGNMGCHVMDGAHWALKLGHPTSIEMEEVTGGTDERYPIGCRLRWDFPARGEMPPVKVYWYDGVRKGVKNAGQGDTGDNVDAGSRNRPPLAAEIEKKYNRKLDGNGTLYVGDKGVMYTGTYGGGTRIIPEEAHKAFPAPPQTLPRVKGGHHGSFFNAVRTGEPASSNFEVASKLSEMILLGCLAIKAGLKNKVEWDGEKMMCTNIPALNRHLKREYRKGWEA